MTGIIKKENIIPAEIAEKIIKLTELKKQVSTQLDDLKDQLLTFTQQNDVYTLKTGSYTISRGNRQTISILDHEAAFAYLVQNMSEPKMVSVLSPSDQELVKKMVKKGQNVDGTTHQSTEYISIRVAKE
jgi:hypothetical protein